MVASGLCSELSWHHRRAVVFGGKGLVMNIDGQLAAHDSLIKAAIDFNLAIQSAKKHGVHSDLTVLESDIDCPQCVVTTSFSQRDIA